MKKTIAFCTLIVSVVFIAGSLRAQTLDAQEIQELLEHPAMVDNADLERDPQKQAAQVEAMIEVVFEPLEPVVPGIVAKMIDISDCESNLNQLWPDGTLKINPNPKSSASGAMQVLLITHRPAYQRIGIDPANAPDNIIFSRVLVEGRIRAKDEEGPFADFECA